MPAFLREVLVNYASNMIRIRLNICTIFWKQREFLHGLHNLWKLVSVGAIRRFIFSFFANQNFSRYRKAVLLLKWVALILQVKFRFMSCLVSSADTGFYPSTFLHSRFLPIDWVSLMFAESVGDQDRVWQLVYVTYVFTPTYIGVRMILDMRTLTGTLIFFLWFYEVFKIFLVLIILYCENLLLYIWPLVYLFVLGRDKFLTV